MGPSKKPEASAREWLTHLGNKSARVYSDHVIESLAALLGEFDRAGYERGRADEKRSALAAMSARVEKLERVAEEARKVADCGTYSGSNAQGQRWRLSPKLDAAISAATQEGATKTSEGK